MATRPGSKSLHRLITTVSIVLLIAAFTAYWVSSTAVTPKQIRPSVVRVGDPHIYPDPAWTPGAINPEITQENIADTICSPNWSTKSVRPSSSYTTRLKKEQMDKWGLAGETHDYEEDHLIPLELGGAPTDARNLWPESYGSPGAREKDVVENFLHRRVCSGAISLAEAQRSIAEDWYKIYVEIR